MAVQATAQITLSSVIDVKATYRYYLLQSSTLTKPAKPSTFPPASTWSDVEPNYVDGSTNSLYFVDCTVFCDDSYNYSEVSLSSAYEAAKSAYNKAVNAQNGVNGLITRVTEAETQIESNKDAIELRATKKEVTESLGNYYTKEQTDAAITIKSNEITQTVSSTYAAKPIIVDNGTQAVKISNALANSIENIKLCGKTTQFTTTGKNLLDINSVKSINYEGAYVKGDTVVIPFGTWRYGVSFDSSPLQVGETYTLSVGTVSEHDDGNYGWRIRYEDGTTSSPVVPSLTLTITKKVSKIYFYAFWGDTTTEDTIISNLQIEIGSVATEYEPYTGGKPAPNPDYPQELESVGDSGAINTTVAGKNLCNAKVVQNGPYNTSVSVSDDGYTIVSVGGSKAWANADIDVDITALRGKTVYLKIDSAENTQEYPSGIIPIANTTSGTVYLNGVQKSRPKSTFVIPENTTKLTLRITTNNTGTTHEVDNTVTIKGLMLSVGDYAEWETYKPIQNITASTPNGLPGIPVPSSGNYTDETGQQWICDEVDLKRGVYVQRIGRSALGAKTWTDWGNNTFYGAQYDKKVGATNMLSNFYPVSSAIREKTLSGNAFNVNIYIMDSAYSTVDELKAALSEAVMLYELAEPIETPLSAEERAAFAELSNEPGTVVVFSEAALEVELSGMASAASVDDAQETANQAKNAADNAVKSIAAAESIIKQLADSITQLVRDGNGGSLIKQDSSGFWYFNIGEIEKSISDTANDVSGLKQSEVKTNAALEILNKTADDLASQVEYVRSYTDENGQPCLELGEGDSIFKVRITNTDIQFAEGTEVPAKLNRKMLVIEKAMVKQELQFGDDVVEDGVWIWKRRANGNLGLSWKGVSS